ncbi:MAG TPA: hypothetical protein VML94_03420 [Thermoplasmata archaeon]|nr:hypothetical protein [Thermoplasmata archaeon]
MAQFIVRVYPARTGVRVVVDGMTDFEADRSESVAALAEAAILQRLRAFLPPRASPPTDPAAISTLFFEIALRPVGDPGRAADPVGVPSVAPRPVSPDPTARPAPNGRRSG